MPSRTPRALRSWFMQATILACAALSLGSAPLPDKRPFFLVVYADWCPYCQQLKPTLALLNEKYKGKIHFVRFDITSETTAAKSQENAQKLGLADFYEKNHERTGVVIILDSSRREVFRTVNDYDPTHYETIIDTQLRAAAE
jgi:thiol-disulfide isomerase/thioredoxin